MATSSTEKSQAAVGSGAARSARGRPRAPTAAAARARPRRPWRCPGSARLGSAQPTLLRLSPARLGSAQSGPARLSPPRLGSAQPGSARLSLPRLGSAGCGRSEPAARSQRGHRACEAELPMPASPPRQTLLPCLELRSLPLHIGVQCAARWSII